MQTVWQLVQLVKCLKHLKQIRRLDAVWVRLRFGMFDGRRECRRVRANLWSCSVRRDGSSFPFKQDQLFFVFVAYSRGMF